jgi:hypothetical protein
VARLAAMARRVRAVFFMSDAEGMMDDVSFCASARISAHHDGFVKKKNA